ncbi:MAG: hypothetical protein ACKVP5_05860 [Aestuariivirga sp.]
MDWTLAIERNRDALLHIVGTLFAMLGLGETPAMGRIPRALHRAVLHILRPAEMAARLLIAVAARGIVLKPRAQRPMPGGKIVEKAKNCASRPMFRLEDIRPRTMSANASGKRSRSERGVQGARVPQAPADDTVNAARLARRLQAIKNALENLPREARRFVRWKAKQEQFSQERRSNTNPIRPAPTSQSRRKFAHDVEAFPRDSRWLASPFSPWPGFDPATQNCATTRWVAGPTKPGHGENRD